MITKFSAFKFRINIFVALVVFLNAIAPLSVVAKELSTSADTGIEALFGEKILICTPTGFKYISIDELHDLQHGDQNAAQSHCPLCQINVFSSLLALVDFGSINFISDHQSDHKIIVESDLFRPGLLFGSVNARAPPIFL